jgi:hypothetical protein
MLISSSRFERSVKKWISSDIWPFKMRPLSGLAMLSSVQLVAECNVAEWWSPLVLTYVLEALDVSIFRVVQEDPPSLRCSKKSTLGLPWRWRQQTPQNSANVYHWTWFHVRRLDSLSALCRNLVSFYLNRLTTFILNLSIPKSHLEIWKFANCNWNLLFRA